MLVLAAGCEEKQPPPPAKTEKKEKEDAKNATDPKLAAAMAAASAAPGSKKAAEVEGPPATGIFGPGAADKVMPLNAEPKVELATDGAEPRVALLASAASWKGVATITTGVRLGPRNALPSLDFLTSLGLEKKDKKDKDKEPSPAGPLSLVGDITSVKLAAEQPGKLPEGLQKEVAKLKGSQLRWKSGEQGVAREPSSVLAKEVPAELQNLQRSLDAAAEAMFYLSVPPPPKPVGAGAIWIAGSRQVLSGVEVISYRRYTVKSVSPEGIQLTLESHEYAARDKFDIAGLPKGAPIVQFEAVAQGEIELPARESLGAKGKITRQMALGLKPENAPAGAVMSVQFVNEAEVKRAAK